MRTAIATVGVGASYPRGVARLLESLNTVGYAGDRHYWTDKLPAGSPPHLDTPYAFKLHALRPLARDGNYDVIFWLDASMWCLRDITPIFEHALEHGATVWRCGFSVADWCDPAPLARLQLNREEAAKIPLVAGGIVAIAPKHPLGAALLEGWWQYATDGVSFKGPWTTHRHDMPSLSTLVHRLGIEPVNCPKWWAYWSASIEQNPEATDTRIVARGMP
jgi:hypothetical protein